MKTLTHKWLLALAVCTAGLLVQCHESGGQEAGVPWYANTYRPYQLNNHLYGRQYGYYGPYSPGPFYGGPGYYRYREYGYGNVYRLDDWDRPGRGGSATVGPLRYGWR